MMMRGLLLSARGGLARLGVDGPGSLIGHPHQQLSNPLVGVDHLHEVAHRGLSPGEPGEGPGHGRAHPKRIRDGRHGRGLVPDGDWKSLSRARPYRPVTLLSQNNGADAKPVVDLNSHCDAVHLTFKIPIHQHQVGLMLGGCEDGLLPRSHRPDEHVLKRVEDVCKAEDLNRVSMCDQDAQRQAPLACWPLGATWLEIDYSTLTRP